jgi:hypothetical protein
MQKQNKAKTKSGGKYKTTYSDTAKASPEGFGLLPQNFFGFFSGLYSIFYSCDSWPIVVLAHKK